MSLHVLVFQAPQTSVSEADAEPRTTRKRSGNRPTCRSQFALLCLALIVASLAAFGCAKPKPPEHPWVVRDGLVEVDTYHRGHLYVKRDHQLDRYDNLMIDGIGFRWGTGEARLQDHDEDRIIAMLLSAIQSSNDGTVGVATEPGPCVLAVNFYIKDLELRKPRWTESSTTSFVSSYGAATMVIELRDSMNREPLARFVQRRDLGGGREIPYRGASLNRLGHVISMALRDMGNQLQRAMPPGSGSRIGECRGGMTNTVLGQR